jgi:hypothetical protein
MWILIFGVRIFHPEGKIIVHFSSIWLTAMTVLSAPGCHPAMQIFQICKTGGCQIENAIDSVPNWNLL